MHFQPVETGSVEDRPEEGHILAVEMDGANAHQDPLDDVFGADSPTQHDDQARHIQMDHPSDMRRLETEHHTAGYREGLTAAKASSVQPGFDEGFSLGASLGQSAGQILGTLEGIEEALRGASAEAADSISAQLTQAREELQVEKLFAPEYWAPDGNWKYEVKGAGGEGEVLFDDVAAQHPLVSKWIGVTNGLIETWKIDRAVLEDEDEPRVDVAGPDAGGAGAGAQPTTTAAPKQALDW